MPPKKPNVYFISAKTHNMTIFLNAPHPSSIASLKTQALSALAQFAESASANFPKAGSTSDFELCRAIKDRRTGQILEYKDLKEDSIVRDTLDNWETIYFRFRDSDGELQEVEVEIPPDDDEPMPAEDIKGKRKERPS